MTTIHVGNVHRLLVILIWIAHGAAEPKHAFRAGTFAYLNDARIMLTVK